MALVTETDKDRVPGPLAPVVREDTDKRLLPPALLQYWHTALRWRWILLGIVGASLAIGLTITLLMSPLYTARSEIEISREQKNITNVQGVDAVANGIDLEFYATQYNLLKAVSLAERVERAMKLSSTEAFFDAHGVKPKADTAARQKQAVTLLLKHIVIDPVRNSKLVDISYTSRSPELAANITNAWVREFIGANMDREFSSTADARHFLEQRLETLRSKMEESERQAVNFASANGIVSLSETKDADGKTQTQRTLASADLEALNQAYAAAQAQRIEAESKLGSGGNGTTSEALSNATISTLRERRSEVAADYAKVLTQFAPGYPAAMALKSQLDDLDSSIAREESRIGGSRRQTAVEALKLERDLESKVTQLKAKLDQQKQASIQYNIYQRDADTNRQLYDALLQRYKEIGVAGAVGASNIAIVDQAQVPTSPSAPSLPTNMALSLLLGIGLAIATVIGLEQIDEGIRGPADIGNLLKIPLLGNVPLINREPMEALIDAKSNMSEAYFSIRSALSFTTTHGLPKTLCLASTQPSEGKTTSAVALSIIIGRTGKSVLLVDADLRSPSVHEQLQLVNEGGFSNLLAGDNDIGKYIQATEHKGLSVLATGPLPPSPAELLSSDRLIEIIANFLHKVRALATQHNIVLIFDECTSGFRQSFGGLHKIYGVEPDMAIFGKTLGNGYAITATIGRREIMEAAQSTFISSTFWTERLGPSAALATLDVMEEARAWEAITAIGLDIRQRWQALADRHGLEIDHWGLPALTGYTFRSEQALAYKTLVTQEMLAKGYLAGNSVYTCISHTPDVVDGYFDALDPVFALIHECEEGRDVASLLKGPVCHAGFKRLN